MIGRHTVAGLLARGDVVTTLQRNETGLATSDRQVFELLGSITDRDSVARACDGQDAIVHFAAKVGVLGSWAEYGRTNVDGTALLIDEARRCGVKALVHVSSPAVAHAGSALVGSAADPADPEATRGHYATSKAIAETLALQATSEAMPIVAIRPHLVWGPGDTQLVGRIIERARQGRLMLVGSGTALIDTTYVDNAASALIAAVDRARMLGGRVFVVSNGEPRTVGELVSRMVSAAGIEWSQKRVPKPLAIGGGTIIERIWSTAGRTDDPPMTRFLAEQLSTAHWFDQRETRIALNWVPHVSLAEGFANLAAWFRSNPA